MVYMGCPMSLWTVMDWCSYSVGLETYLTLIYWFNSPMLLNWSELGKGLVSPFFLGIVKVELLEFDYRSRESGGMSISQHQIKFSPVYSKKYKNVHIINRAYSRCHFSLCVFFFLNLICAHCLHLKKTVVWDEWVWNSEPMSGGLFPSIRSEEGDEGCSFRKTSIQTEW